MIHIEIKTDNAAFTDDACAELGRILHGLAERLSNHSIDPGNSWESATPLVDYNGNIVGKFWDEVQE